MSRRWVLAAIVGALLGTALTVGLLLATASTVTVTTCTTDPAATRDVLPAMPVCK